MLNICRLRYDFSRILNWLTRPLNFMQNNVRNFRQNGNSISRKMCKVVKLGFPILYAVEKFGSLLSKDKLQARGTHTPTHDPTLPRMSWENCHGSQPIAPTCCVELALKGMLCTTFGIKGSLRHRFSLFLDPMVMPQMMHSHKGKTLPTWCGLMHAWDTGQGMGWCMCFLL